MVVAGCLAGVLAPATAQAVVPTPQISVSPSLSDAQSVAVGGIGFGQVVIRNITEPEAVLTPSDVTLIPSCGGLATAAGSCTVPDSGVITVLTAGGIAPGQCSTAQFMLGVLDSTGKLGFSPLLPLGEISTRCTIQFPYIVDHMPFVDSNDNPDDGMQTDLVAYAKATASGLWTSDVGSQTVTVTKAVPSVTVRGLQEDVGSVEPGTALTALGAVLNGVHPDGGLTFKIYKGTNCDSSPVKTFDPVVVDDNGAHGSPLPSFVATDAGEYHWKAEYSGDRDNSLKASDCSNATRVAAPAVQPPPPPPPPPPAGPGDGGTGGTTPGGGGTTPGTGDPDGTGSRNPGTNVVPTRVRLDGFGLSRKTFARATKVTALAATAAKAKKRKPMAKGTTIKYRLSAPAVVTIVVERAGTGRRLGAKCVKASKKLKSKRPCTRYVKVSTLKRTHRSAGAKKVAFSGRAGRKALTAGSYRMRASASAGPGTTSLTRTAKFKIVKR